MKKSIKSLTLIILTISAIPAFAEDQDIADFLISFRPNETLCVGYKVTKQVPILGTTEVFGTKCDEITVENNQNNEIQIILKPIFESGNGKRDSHVKELLGGENLFPIVVTIKDYKALLNIETEVIVTGTIQILNETTPVSVVVTKLNTELYGIKIKITFSSLKIKKPEVGPFGIGGSVNDELILFGKISKDRAESSLSKKNKGL